MTKKFTIPCNVNGQSVMTDFFIGQPKADQHPIAFQAKWLGSEKNGVVPNEVMDSIAKIKKIADEKNVSFEDLCIYTINIANNIGQEDNKLFNDFLLEADNNVQQIEA